MCDGVI